MRGRGRGRGHVRVHVCIRTCTRRRIGTTPYFGKHGRLQHRQYHRHHQHQHQHRSTQHWHRHRHRHRHRHQHQPPDLRCRSAARPILRLGPLLHRTDGCCSRCRSGCTCVTGVTGVTGGTSSATLNRTSTHVTLHVLASKMWYSAAAAGRKGLQNISGRKSRTASAPPSTCRCLRPHRCV